MNLANYEPWQALRSMRNEINSLFGEGTDLASEMASGNWVPAVDIQEDDNAYRIKADVPGVDPKDVEVTLENGVLSLSGERKQEKPSAHDYSRVERQYGAFLRRFTLPSDADPENVTAEGKHGTLEITVGKSEKAKPKRIEVKS